jgi:cobalt-zinc-cadmium resistance protein CzcA
LAGLGWVSFQALPIDAVPDITNNQVQVNTAAFSTGDAGHGH